MKDERLIGAGAACSAIAIIFAIIVMVFAWWPPAGFDGGLYDAAVIYDIFTDGYKK